MTLADNNSNGARPMRRIAPSNGYVVIIVFFLALILASAFYLSENLLRNFSANPPINGLIVVITTLGSLYLLMQVRSLRHEIRWFHIAASVVNGSTHPSIISLQDAMAKTQTPKLLAPLNQMVHDSLDVTNSFGLSAASISNAVSVAADRIEERREVTRYLVGVVIFLGLLGTFWGLMGTIEGISAAISNLGQGGDLEEYGFFLNLSDNLKGPLGGISIAFGSAMFGMVGFLILGFVELIAGQAHNRVYNDMEAALKELFQTAPKGRGIAGDGLSEEVAEINRQLVAMRQEMTAGRQALSQQLMALNQTPRQ